MKWIKIASEADLPKKPGVRPYEQIDCLVLHKDAVKLLVWNCEHRVWDDDSGDDYFCDALEPTHYCVIEWPDEA